MIKDNDYNIYRDNEGNEYNKISLFEAIQQSWSDIGTNGGILGGGGDPGSINLDTGAYNNASLGKLTVDKLLSIFKGAKRDYVGACLAVLSKYGTKVGLTDKAQLLRQPYGVVCAVVLVELLRQQLCLLPVSY